MVQVGLYWAYEYLGVGWACLVWAYEGSGEYLGMAVTNNIFHLFCM